MTTAKGEKELNITEDDWHLLLWSLHTCSQSLGWCYLICNLIWKN